MSEALGRARPFIILAPIAAFLLMLVALIVAASNAGQRPAPTTTPSTIPAGTTVPSLPGGAGLELCGDLPYLPRAGASAMRLGDHARSRDLSPACGRIGAGSVSVLAPNPPWMRHVPRATLEPPRGRCTDAIG